MNSESPTLTLLAGGDVGPIVQPVDRLAELIRPTLDNVDFRFMQCERTYSERGYFPGWTTLPNRSHSRLSVDHASIFQAARADVVSLASNHTLDFGNDPMFDTLDLFRGWGMQVIGAGVDGASARAPAILEKDGIRVAVLAYCSVLRDGQAAGDGVPGVAAVRVRTSYEAVDFQPGAPPLVRTEALPEDVQAMQHDIAAARDDADAVVVSMHWGVAHIPKILAEYQVPVAHAAMDAGADVILGHHPHMPKAVETYGSSTCFYSIGNFLTTGGGYTTKPPHAKWNVFWYEPYDPESLYTFPEYCRMAVLPKLSFSTQGVARVAMVPVFINGLAQPEPLTRSDERFSRIFDYLEWVSDQFPHQLEIEGDEIVVVPATSGPGVQ